MNETIFLLVRITLTVLCALIGKYLIPALKAYAQNYQDQKICKMIETAVRAAEQTFKESGQGTLKKEQVIVHVSNWLSQKGIEIETSRLDCLIEECVYLLNNPTM